MAKPLARAARVGAVASVRGRWRPYRSWTGAEITDYDPFDPRTAAQPHEAYRGLHAGGRVHYNPNRNIWILSRLADVKAGARAADTLYSGDGVTRARVALPLLVTTDGKRHNEMRRHVLPAFTKAALESWRPMIDELAAKLVGEVLDAPGCDVVQRLTIPMPMLLIAHMLGVPDGDLNEFRRWSEATVQATEVELSRRGIMSLTSSITGIRDIHRYFRNQFAVGGLKGSDTILGKLLDENAGGSISDDELFFFAFLLLLAGNETTTNLLGGMFDMFARRPETFDMIRANHDLIPMAVEELLRFYSPVQGLYRTARTDYQVGDVTIPAGARVLLCIGAANRDPQVFDDPDEFRVDRNPTEHMAFGFGAHLCLGAQLTRMEARAVLRELATRVDRIEVIGQPRWSTNSTLRGPVEMTAKLFAAAAIK
ncbi:cytochrome P450 [Rhodococcus erythropolis]|nr:cytochrome P450 [Rhodococcus erythropolis]